MSDLSRSRRLLPATPSPLSWWPEWLSLQDASTNDCPATAQEPGSHKVSESLGLARMEELAGSPQVPPLSCRMRTGCLGYDSKLVTLFQTRCCADFQPSPVMCPQQRSCERTTLQLDRAQKLLYGVYIRMGAGQDKKGRFTFKP